MSIVTIPFDYDELSDPYVVPICIEDTDQDGCPINRGWFRAVVPVAGKLRRLSVRVLDDVWRVSEVTESAVHALWYKHRDNLGCSPSAQVYAHAKWTALDLRYGGRNPRRGVEVEFLDSIRRRILASQDIHGQMEVRELREKLKHYFERNGVDHVDTMLDMWLYNYEWTEIAAYVGKKPKAATKDFWRWWQRALRDLDLR